VIPCHRVIGSKGDLVGCGDGMGKKAYLLNLEKTIQ
jgi:methylated-DNA-[protein]-cysteine S-methyltransferase